MKSFIDKTVDFGASDAAMKPEDIARVESGVQLLPMTAGSIVLTYNLEGVTDLKLSRMTAPIRKPVSPTDTLAICPCREKGFLPNCLFLLSPSLVKLLFLNAQVNGTQVAWS